MTVGSGSVMDTFQERKNVFLAVLFTMFVITIQLEQLPLVTVCIVLGVIFFILGSEQDKSFVKVTLLFSAGFSLYLFVSTQLVSGIEPREWEVFLKRGALLFIVLPLWLWSGEPLIGFFRKPNWHEPFILPFHRTTIKRFLLIALSANVVVFLPFIVQNGWLYIKEAVLLALVFSLTNAILEEWIWRGVLLHRFSAVIGVQNALWVTSLGFGLQHYSLGFSWLVCLAFALGGLFYGVITVQSKSLIPAIVWHLALNMLMVFGGLIESS